MDATDPTDATRLLRIYLQDHFAGATAGLALVRRCHRANASTSHGPMLANLETDIDQDRQALVSIMGRLDVQPSRLKSVVGSSAELVGRLKSNGRLLRRSPSSTVVELEGLAAGILTKRNLWRSLASLGFDATELQGLIERATAQLERVQQLHEAAATEAFSSPSRLVVPPA